MKLRYAIMFLSSFIILIVLFLIRNHKSFLLNKYNFAHTHTQINGQKEEKYFSQLVPN